MSIWKNLFYGVTLAWATAAQAATFTYQGQLSDNGSPATNNYDFEFLLFDAASAGTQAGSTVSLSAVPVTDGIFQVELDFGNTFDGSDYWLEVHVRPGGDTGGYTQLLPRQYLSFNPNAQYALEAGVASSASTASTASDGPFWKLGGNTGTGSGDFIGTSDNNPLELRVNGLRVGLITAPNTGSHSPNVLFGSKLAYIDPGVVGATISGGGVVGASTCGDGTQLCVNSVFGDYATVSGGTGNYATSPAATVGGGASNTANDDHSTVAGGFANRAFYRSTVSGGFKNTARGGYAAIPGGIDNLAGGEFSFAAGRRAKVRDGDSASTYYSGDFAGDQGTFIWADSTDADLVSTGDNQFLVRASGGIWFGTDSSPSIPSGRFINTSTGGYLSTGGTWTNSSDRNRKTNFQSIDSQAVLEKVISLPILRWNYKEEDDGTLHLGPMAQDFYAAFGLGADDKHIATVDADGVALAAIQALARENQALKTKLAQLQQALQALQANQQQLLSHLQASPVEKESESREAAQ